MIETQKAANAIGTQVGMDPIIVIAIIQAAVQLLLACMQKPPVMPADVIAEKLANDPDLVWVKLWKAYKSKGGKLANYATFFAATVDHCNGSTSDHLNAVCQENAA